jgi:hypothetical protein
MGMAQIIPKMHEEEGSGILGSVIGGLTGLAAALAAPATGGASLLATIGSTLGAGAAGSALGGMIGNAVDPASAGYTKLVPAKLDNASKNNPMAQMAILNSSQKALGSTDLPQPVAEDYLNRISDAKGVLAQRLKVGQEWI